MALSTSSQPPHSAGEKSRIVNFLLLPQVEVGGADNDLPGTILATSAAIACGSCSPAVPSSVYDRSNALGPVILISHRSLPCEPTIETFHSPGRSESTCSTITTTSRCNSGSPVLCISTATAMLRVYDSHLRLIAPVGNTNRPVLRIVVTSYSNAVPQSRQT